MYERVQDVQSFPFEMSSKYFQNIKPTAILRTWYNVDTSGATGQFTYGVYLQFINQGSKVAGKDVGFLETYQAAESHLNQDYFEINHLVQDLSSFEFDAVRY